MAGADPGHECTRALFSNGASMLLAALPGYVGCEVLAVSDWFPHRDDFRSAGLQRWARPGWHLDDPTTPPS